MSNATITVKLFGTLRRKDESDQTLTISEHETIQQAIARLSIESHSSYLYSINGQHVKADAILYDGDTLMIIPPISGG
ncbi:MAG TPA: MoaD/ThiS family protein [Dissulfurispiraceae bacterium]|nr:MoaD/ThiS family protein [Dissulfurispiraceae bacterium]